MAIYKVYLAPYSERRQNPGNNRSYLCTVNGGWFGWRLAERLASVSSWAKYGYDLYATKDDRHFIAYWRDIMGKGL